MSKKIIISANVLFTITNFRRDLLNFLKERGFEIICVVSVDELSDNSLEYFKENNIRFHNVNIDRKGINPVKDLKYLFSLIKIYKKEKPYAVMHFTIKPNIYGTIAAKLSGTKSINTINGLGSGILMDNFLSKIIKFMYKYSLIFSSKVYFQNDDDKNLFINNNLVSKEKVSIVPGSGVDTSAFDNCQSNNSKLTFLLVARILRDKGINEYFDAIKNIKKKYKDINFLIGGPIDSGNPSSMQLDEIKIIENEGLVKYIGTTNDIREFLKLADVVVFPSYREGLSRFLIESASAGKPILTTNIAGCKDVVDDGVNGFLCDVKCSKSLEKAIEKMILLDKNKLTEMGKSSKQKAKEKFDKDIVNKIYLEGINSL